MLATFGAIFRIILPDTPGFARQTQPERWDDEYEIDALDALAVRLTERQAIHRLSDREMMHGVSQVVRNIIVQDDPSGTHFGPAQPALFAVNCTECHLVGGSQLRSSNLKLPVCFFFGVLSVWDTPRP